MVDRAPPPSRRSAATPQPTQAIGRRERAKQAKRESIIEAARSLFEEKGFAATTTQEIATRADIGTGTLFLYAQTKEDLLVMVFREEMIAIQARAFQGAPPKASFVDQLMYVFGCMVDYHEIDIEVARVLMRQVTIATNSERQAEVKEMLDGVRAGIGALIARQKRAGRLSGAFDLVDAAEIIFAVYLLGLLQWLSGYRTRDEFMRRLPSELALVTRGLE